MSAIITIAPTGPIATKADNPALPTQPEEIASAVASAAVLGASVAHIHLRDPEDRPTANPAIARKTVELIRERSGILIQLSTGVGLSVPFEERAALIELQPEMATLNPCTMSFGDGVFSNPPQEVERLAARMLDLGIKPELEIYDTGHLEACLRLRDRGLLAGDLQFSIVLGVRGGMAATAENLVTMVGRLPEGSIWQVIAIGRANLALTAVGLAMGGNVRVGMEDTLYESKGVLARSNDILVSKALAQVASLDRTIASVEDARRMLLSVGAAARR